MNFYASYTVFPPLFPKSRSDLKLFSQTFYMGFVERKIPYKIHCTRFSYSISRASESGLQTKKRIKQIWVLLENSIVSYEDPASWKYRKRLFCSGFWALSNEMLAEKHIWKITNVDAKYRKGFFLGVFSDLLIMFPSP